MRLSPGNKTKVTEEMNRHVTVVGTMTSTISARRLAAIEAIARALVHLVDIVVMVARIAGVVATAPRMAITVAMAVADVVAAKEEGENIVNEAQIDNVGVTVQAVGTKHCHHQVQEIFSMTARFRPTTSKVPLA